MTLLQLRYFREVAHTKHFTAAAENLHVAQPSLSYSIKELEKELGVPLFTRSANKKIDLTVYGSRFLTYAERALDALDEGCEALKEREGGPLSGTVKLGVYYCISTSLLPKVQNLFNSDYPDNKLNCETHIFHTHVNSEELLTKGTVDLFLSTTNHRNNCESAPVAIQKTYVLLPAGHPLASRRSLRITDLENETLIGSDPGCKLDRDIQGMIHAAGVRMTQRYCPEWSQQLTLVAQGEGIALSPRLPMNEELMRAVELDDEMSDRIIYLSWATNRKLPKQVEFFRDFITDKAADDHGIFTY